jgi:hypothetical protein
LLVLLYWACLVNFFLVFLTFYIVCSKENMTLTNNKFLNYNHQDLIKLLFESEIVVGDVVYIIN